MWRKFWTSKSIRFWVGSSMALVIVPLSLSAVLGYAVIKHGVLDSFKDIAARQRDQIGPTQQLQLALWEAAIPIDQYVDNGNPSEIGMYRALRQKIEASFARLHDELRSEVEAQNLLERARTDWSAADVLGTEILSVRRAPGDAHGAELSDKFGNLIASANDKLGAITEELGVDLANDYSDALFAYERAEWIAGIAAAVSLLFIVASIWMIGRILAASIDRLVDGASRFGSGDRDFRVEISIPPELSKVADEFNRMIIRIHESEQDLADLARRDKLTGAPNRRAFDEALSESFKRLERMNDLFALLVVDVDHFKHVNDTYGHAGGDQVLRVVWQVLKSSLREIDKVFRIGGEEFAVLLPGTDQGSAKVTAARLCSVVAAQPIKAEGVSIAVTISIGIALPGNSGTPEALMKEADTALYQAKAQGRNRFVINQADAA